MYTANKFEADLRTIKAGKGIPWKQYEKNMWPNVFENFKGMVSNFQSLAKSEKDPYKFLEKLVKAYPGRPNELTQLFGNLAFDVGPKEAFNNIAGTILNVFYFKDKKIEDIIDQNQLSKDIQTVVKVLK